MLGIVALGDQRCRLHAERGCIEADLDAACLTRLDRRASLFAGEFKFIGVGTGDRQAGMREHQGLRAGISDDQHVVGQARAAGGAGLDIVVKEVGLAVFDHRRGLAEQLAGFQPLAGRGDRERTAGLAGFGQSPEHCVVLPVQIAGVLTASPHAGHQKRNVTPPSRLHQIPT